jgi:trk system potassium uptake protein TrkA
MKFIIIGLGNFGSNLSEKLTLEGHEVVAVDIIPEKVETIKDRVTHAICLNCKDPEAIRALPLRNSDIVVVAIGEDEGSNILVTALLKKTGVKRLISRSVSPLHDNILEAMGITEIVRPEEEGAERWAKRLTTNGLVDSFELSKDYTIVKAEVPAHFVGKTIQEVGFNHNYNILVLSVIRYEEEFNLLGIKRKVLKNQGIATAETLLKEHDVLVLYGLDSDLKLLLGS